MPDLEFPPQVITASPPPKKAAPTQLPNGDLQFPEHVITGQAPTRNPNGDIQFPDHVITGKPPAGTGGSAAQPPASSRQDSDFIQFPEQVIKAGGGSAAQPPASSPSDSDVIRFPEDRIVAPSPSASPLSSPAAALEALGHWVGDLF